MGGESPQSVIEYTPHGCRHFSVTSATQLKAQGVLGSEALESLGHWERGSKMPLLYDNARCVTELQARKTVGDALRSGWRPAEDGQLPMPATPGGDMIKCPGTPALAIGAPNFPSATIESTSSDAATTSNAPRRVMVYNNKRHRVHIVLEGQIKSLCDTWTCGTAAKPSWNAEFAGPMNATKCTVCFRR